MKRWWILISLLALVVGVAFASLVPDLRLSVVVLVAYAILLLLAQALLNLTNWIDPTTLFIAGYVTFIGIGVPFAGQYGIELRPSLLIALIVGLAALLAGIAAGDLLLSPTRAIMLRRRVRVYQQRVPGAVVWALMFYGVGVLAMGYFFLRVGGVPLLFSDAENSRISVRAGSAYLPLLAYGGLMTGSLSLIAHARGWKGLAGAGLLAFLGTIVLLGGGFRAPAMKLLVGAFIVFAYVTRSRIPLTWLAMLGSGALLLVGLLGFFRSQAALTTDLSLIVRLGVWRFFVNNLYVLELIFNHFPTFDRFMLGRSYLIDAITLLPGPQDHFGFWLKERMGMVFDGGGVTQTIVGEFYLNFGWPGIVIGMFGLGLAFRTLYRGLVRSGTISADTVVLMTILGIALQAMVSSGVSLVLLFEVLPAMVFYTSYRFARRLRLQTSTLPQIVAEQR